MQTCPLLLWVINIVMLSGDGEGSLTWNSNISCTEQKQNDPTKSVQFIRGHNEAEAWGGPQLEPHPQTPERKKSHWVFAIHDVLLLSALIILSGISRFYLFTYSSFIFQTNISFVSSNCRFRWCFFFWFCFLLKSTRSLHAVCILPQQGALLLPSLLQTWNFPWLCWGRD